MFAGSWEHMIAELYMPLMQERRLGDNFLFLFSGGGLDTLVVAHKILFSYTAQTHTAE